MKGTSLYLVLLTLACSVLGEVPYKDGVYTVKDNNYEEFVELARSRNATFCIKFHSPMCQHCQDLKPVFVDAAQRMENDPDGSYIFGEINVLTQEELGKHFDVKSLPTIYTFSPVDDYIPGNYDGPREALAITMGVEAAAGLTLRQLPNYEEFQKRLELRDEHILLGIFKDEKSSLFKQVEDLKKDLPFVRTYYTLNVDDFKKHLNLGDGEEFILKFHNKQLLGKDDEKFVKYTADKYSNLREFILQEYPYPIDFKSDKVNRIFAMRKRPEAVLFTPFENRTEQVYSLIQQMKPLALKYKDKFNLYIEDTRSREGRLHRFEGNATFIIFNIDKDDSKYRYSDKVFYDQIDVNSLIDFTQSFLDGKAPRYIRSAEFNKDDLGLPVVSVIASSFDEVVKDPTKHVFLRYYNKMEQRFSEHYEMRTEWYKVGRHFLNNTREDLIIAEIETKDNDVPKYFIKEMLENDHYFFLFTKDNKENPIVYKGEPKADKLIKFVEEQIGTEKGKVKIEL